MLSDFQRDPRHIFIKANFTAIQLMAFQIGQEQCADMQLELDTVQFYETGTQRRFRHIHWDVAE